MQERRAKTVRFVFLKQGRDFEQRRKKRGLCRVDNWGEKKRKKVI